MQPNETTLIAHLGNEHNYFFFDFNGLHIKKSSLVTGKNILIGDYEYSSQKYFENFVQNTDFDKYEKIVIDFNQYKGYEMGPDIIWDWEVREAHKKFYTIVDVLEIDFKYSN